MKRILAFICAIIFCFTLFIGSMPAAHADVMTAAMFGAAAYGYAQASGLTWIFGNQSTATSATNWMTNQVNSWLDGRDLTQVIGEEVLRVEVGKLIVPYQIGVAIGEFINSLIDKHDITPDNITELSPGEINGLPLSSMSRNYTAGMSPQTLGLEVCSPNNLAFSEDGTWYSGGTIRVCYNGSSIYNFKIPSYYTYFYGWYPFLENGTVYFLISGNRSTDGTQTGNRTDFVSTFEINVPASDITGQISAQMQSDFALPEYVDVGYQWEGTIDGVAPDTNLDQLIDIINQDVADNNLIIEGEVVNPIDPPVPPTPVPVDPDTPLQDVPWDGLNDLIGLTGDGIEDAINSQTGTLEDIDTKTGEISETLEDTNEAVQTISETLQPTEIQERTFDLRRLFPFCIPFDIYNLLSQFDSTPVAPHVYLPFTIPSLGFTYNFDLDFSAFDGVAAALRAVELIVYCIGLAWATSKVIKW